MSATFNYWNRLKIDLLYDVICVVLAVFPNCYAFSQTADSTDDNVRNASQTIHLNVVPAWYETWTFRIIALITLMVLIAVVYKLLTDYRIRKERQKNLEKHYHIISMVVAAINHDIQTPMYYVSYTLKQLNAYLAEQEAKNSLVVLVAESLKTSLRIETHTKNLVNYIKLQTQNPDRLVRTMPVNLHSLLSECCEIFNAVADFKKIEIQNDIDPSLIVNSDASLLSIIIHNLLDNAMKFSSSNIVVTSEMVGRSVALVISDKGTGMSAELAAWLGKHYRSYSEWLNATDYPAQNGVGLMIVKDLTSLLEIELLVRETGVSGSTIALVFAPENL